MAVKAAAVLLLALVCSYTVMGADDRDYRPVGGPEWEYTGPLGPNYWHRQYGYCEGDMQSPINIDNRLVQFDPNLLPFDLRQYAYCNDCHMELENVNGHTVEVKVTGGPTIRGGSLPDEYMLDQIHFHWGSNDNVGSEHTVDNRAAPMEMHIVHHVKKYTKLESATIPGGLVVLSFLFKIGEHNSNFDQLLSQFKYVVHDGQRVHIRPISLYGLLPRAASFGNYYRYFGSLTTPPCYETVIWSVFMDRIEISPYQMNMFRSLKTKRAYEPMEVNLVNNYRPLQNPNPEKRRVTYRMSSAYNEK